MIGMFVFPSLFIESDKGLRHCEFREQQGKAGLASSYYRIYTMKSELRKTLFTIDDPVKKRALFIAILSKRIVDQGAEMAIVVGGEALEIYTQGNYTTGDIDIKSSYNEMEAALFEMGFRKRGRAFYSEELDIFVDWLGASLEEGTDAEQRTVLVEIDQDHVIRLISVEDLIIDRLNAAKWWKDSYSRGNGPRNVRLCNKPLHFHADAEPKRGFSSFTRSLRTYSEGY